MTRVGMHEAKTRLSQLVEQALGGEEVVLTRRGQPVARLVPVQPAGGVGALRGAWAGRASMAEDFDELPDDIAEAFGWGERPPDRHPRAAVVDARRLRPAGSGRAPA